MGAKLNDAYAVGDANRRKENNEEISRTTYEDKSCMKEKNVEAIEM